jgi:hypothetical protein
MLLVFFLIKVTKIFFLQHTKQKYFKMYKIFQFILFSIATASTSKKYDVQNNQYPSSAQNWLISSFKTKSKISCLAKCNSNENCWTAVYQIESIENCFLYSKIFSLIETEASNFSVLLSKKCKKFYFSHIILILISIIFFRR